MPKPSNRPRNPSPASPEAVAGDSQSANKTKTKAALDRAARFEAERAAAMKRWRQRPD
jgi:hypothetical protein